VTVPEEKQVFYHFQKAALTKWRKNGYRGGIFFEPGLGKSYLSQHATKMLFRAKKLTTVLILVPAIIIDMWEDDMTKLGFTSWEDMLVIRAGVMQEHVDKYLVDHPQPRIIITTYTLFRARTYPRPDMYILDESHNVKNPDSKALRAIVKMVRSTDKVLLLSGTPIPSGVEDFFSQFMVIKPGYLASSLRDFRITFEKLKYAGAHTYLPQKDMLPVLRNMVRRYASFKKAVDAIELPPITETTSRYALSPKQVGAIDILKAEGYALNEAEDEEEQVEVESPAIRMLLMQQMCSGFASMNIKEVSEGDEVDLDTGLPVVMRDDEVRVQIELDLREDADTPIQKEELLVHDLENLEAVHQRALVWINFTKTAERVASVLERSQTLKDKFSVITGKTTLKKRRKILEAYAKGDIMYIIAHPKTLGTGLNLFAGNTQYIFWYELTPDFALVEQANGRIYRKGQELPVFIKYYVASGDSVEKRVQYIVKTKGNLKDMMFRSYLKLKK